MDNTIVRLTEDGLTQTSWRFSLFDFTAVLSEYLVVTRPSKKAKFKTDAPTIRYDRLYSRSNIPASLTEDQVPIPDDVKDEIRQRIINEIKVVSWAEHTARR